MPLFCQMVALSVGWFSGFLPYREPCLLTSVMPLHKTHPPLQMKGLLRKQQVNCTRNNKQKAQEGDKTQKRSWWNDAMTMLEKTETFQVKEENVKK